MNGRCLQRVSLLLTLFLALILVAAAQKPTGPECKDDKSCSGGQFCQKPSGNCGGAGHCVAKPTVCFFIYDPVCGCDGMTYSNSCIAASAGVNVKHNGVCKSNCTTNAQCKTAGQYCSKATGHCKGEGLCATKPQICPDIFDPVCGCDGKTYGNSCEAAREGINVTHLGACAVAKK